jgi:hypothetical protein
MSCAESSLAKSKKAIIDRIRIGMGSGNSLSKLKVTDYVQIPLVDYLEQDANISEISYRFL